MVVLICYIKKNKYELVKTKWWDIFGYISLNDFQDIYTLGFNIDDILFIFMFGDNKIVENTVNKIMYSSNIMMITCFLTIQQLLC